MLVTDSVPMANKLPKRILLVQRGISSPVTGLFGEVSIPGDKSISHRAMMLGSLAIGDTHIEGLLEAEDILRTASALQEMGIDVRQIESKIWRVTGLGVGGLTEPDDILNMGNAGTGARLILGIMATHDMTAFLTGDASLRARPMARIIKPLTEIGAQFISGDSERLHMAIVGSKDPIPIKYQLPVPSAQIKSAILLAGLNAPGITSVIVSGRHCCSAKSHTYMAL